ncbi:hypothetical protein L1987_31733 [Smallanthus sonchifolius]|uniref:Uncharacterized protein n=1 Tax=Smallanthus sonchifolius TaxID=185202 RepID=A0ACB9I944_9ASTR|nr:hypothetical protein L1987_31733 [Smallanthus sonchifolius]
MAAIGRVAAWRGVTGGVGGYGDGGDRAMRRGRVWKQRIQVGFLFEPVRFQSLSQSVKLEGGNPRRWPSWKGLKRRLGWKQINILGFCGSSKWAVDNSSEEAPFLIPGDESPVKSDPRRSCFMVDDCTTMNLATALAADRRQINVGSTDWVKVKPLKSIVRLFEEIDGRDVKVAHDGGGEGGGGIGTLCCHCTERNKGATLIPCGHTYCRMCSRWMWSKQEPCPLCNRSIMDVLEMF